LDGGLAVDFGDGTFRHYYLNYYQKLNKTKSQRNRNLITDQPTQTAGIIQIIN